MRTNDCIATQKVRSGGQNCEPPKIWLPLIPLYFPFNPNHVVMHLLSAKFDTTIRRMGDIMKTMS